MARKFDVEEKKPDELDEDEESLRLIDSFSFGKKKKKGKATVVKR